MLPAIVDVAFARENSRAFHLWLPVIVLWPVLLIFIIIIAPFALLAELILFKIGIKPFSILMTFLWVINCLRGITVDISSKSGNYQNFSVKII